MALAVISDIHGNRWALEAVLQDLSRTPTDAILNLGDSLWGVLDPSGTADLLMPLSIRHVRGNTDRDLLAPPSATPSVAEEHSRFALTEGRRKWLEDHEQPFEFEGVLACHGTPASDSTVLLEEVTDRGATRRSGDAVREHLGVLRPSVSLVLCGHSHVPGTVQVPDGPLVLNPGSVGLPAYRHDVPYPHRMESGTPHARYAVVHRGPAGWNIEHRAVVYDWEAAARRATEVGRLDWAHQLRTGHARPSR